MQFLGKWELKFGWVSFPGFLRYYAIFNIAVFLLQFINPTIGLLLNFDRGKILSGEVWRLVTFLFADSAIVKQGPLQTLFIFIMVMLSFMMSDALEQAWGVFRTSIYHYFGYVCLIIANFIYDIPFGTGMLVFSSSFLAFATLYPRVELRMMFIIPVEVRWLAMLAAAYYAFNVLRFPLILGCYLLAFANYLLWAGIPALRGQARVVQAVQRRRKFQKESYMDENAFHRCAVCDRTELSDPELDFRMSADGKEYCSDHLKD